MLSDFILIIYDCYDYINSYIIYKMTYNIKFYHLILSIIFNLTKNLFN